MRYSLAKVAAGVGVAIQWARVMVGQFFRGAKRLVWNRVTVGVAIVAGSVALAFWSTDTRAPPEDIRGIGLGVPNVALPGRAGYVGNMTILVPKEKVGNFWTLGETCRNPVRVNGYFELTPEVWRTRRDELDGATTDVYVGILGGGIKSFRFYGASTDADPVLVDSGRFFESRTPYSPRYAEVYHGLMRNWSSHRSKVEFRFEADWLFLRSRGSCYLRMPSLVGANASFPGSGPVEAATGGDNSLVTDAFVEHDEAVPPASGLYPPDWFCDVQPDEYLQADCAAVVPLSRGRRQGLPTFLVFVLGAAAAVGAELALSRLVRS